MADADAAIAGPEHAADTHASRIVSALREEIMRLELRPGDQISETDIGMRYGVSRQPVREAFIRLSQSGLVLVRPKRATTVVKISERAVLRARFIREAIEVEIVRRAARVAVATDIATLESLIAAQEKAADRGDLVTFHRHDEAFHEEIARIAGVEFAWAFIDDQKMQLDRVRFMTLAGATPRTIGEHRAIIAALAARDADASEGAMRLHLSRIEELLARAKTELPDYFE
ncbi:GntR family transcriptional regulator [Arsenicitalea aurantiaca]|nr:GntR family transcriptional regulator [Arsenicitalea aurantiaca]